MTQKNKHLFVSEVQDKQRIADFEGCDGTKGLPFLMSAGQVPEAKACVGFFMSRKDASIIERIHAGDRAGNIEHIHDHDEMYFVFGEGKIEMTVTLGHDTYKVTAPGAAYVPAGLPHSVYISDAEEGKFNGICSVLLNGEYIAKEVPAVPLMLEDTSHLIVRELKWVSDLPDHDAGSSDYQDVGFPFLLNRQMMPESKVCYAPYYVTVPQQLVDLARADKLGKATPHKHHDDEMYLLFGEQDAVSVTITLGDEEYVVPNPAVIYIPHPLPHSIRISDGQAGQFGGASAFLICPDYYTEPLTQ